MFFLITTLFSVLLSSATLVPAVRNPIHSLLFLIAVFFTGSLLFIYARVEFFALMFLIVYVGAIVVLFLFIVMMLQIKIAAQTSQNDFDIVLFFGPIFALAFFYKIDYDDDSLFLVINYIDALYTQEYLNLVTFLTGPSHIQTIGQSLFNPYVFPFLIIGFLLFIAMLGAIVITIENPSDHLVKQQVPIDQTLKTHTSLAA